MRGRRDTLAHVFQYDFTLVEALNLCTVGASIFRCVTTVHLTKREAKALYYWFDQVNTRTWALLLVEAASSALLTALS
jgi:hypothetical protein